MKRVAAALVFVVPVLGLAAAGFAGTSASPIDGMWQGGVVVQISGSTGTVTTAGHFSVNTGTEPLCRHQVGQQIFSGIAGSGNHYTGNVALLQFPIGGTADTCTPDTPRAAAFDLVEASVLRVCVASASGQIDTSSTSLCRTMVRVGGGGGATTTVVTRVGYLFLVSARADAVKMQGIPAKRFYSTSDVQGAGKVDVDPRHGPSLVDGTGSVKIKHEYISDQLPDITMTLKVGDKGSVLKGSGGDVILVDATVTASSIKACRGRTAGITLTEGPPAMVAVTACGSSFLLVDGKGPKGPDPTNDVRVKIESS